MIQLVSGEEAVGFHCEACQYPDCSFGKAA
jgi:hypothetical protein